MTDPKKLMFITEDVGKEPGEEFTLLHRISPDATIIHPSSKYVASAIVSTIEGQVKKFGTLKEIVIAAHGMPNMMSVHRSGGDVATLIDMRGLLGELAQSQKQHGTKIADRIVFLGCNTLTEETPEQIEMYRNLAKQLGTQIVGTTSLEVGGPLQVARFVQFTPNGQVIRDPLDDSVFNRSLSAILSKEGSDAWVDCHIGHSQQEGAACQQKKVAAASDDDRKLPGGSLTEEIRKMRNYDAMKTGGAAAEKPKRDSPTQYYIYSAEQDTMGVRREGLRNYIEGKDGKKIYYTEVNETGKSNFRDAKIVAKGKDGEVRVKIEVVDPGLWRRLHTPSHVPGARLGEPQIVP
jgi:hypothetical protein